MNVVRSSGVVYLLAALLSSTSPASEPPADPAAGPELGFQAHFQADGKTWLETDSGHRLELPVDSVTSNAESDDGWIVAGTRTTAKGSDLVLFRGNGPERVRLDPPRDRRGPLREEPQLLVNEGRLTGLAWLEGPRHGALRVRYAAWEGAAWLPAERISEPGPGSQLALSGAVLKDGSILLVWSAFDGEDDEIVWSRRTSDGWSEPRRLGPDNRVPDITPVLAPGPAATANGALAVWSRFEAGGYRLVTSRFTGGRWGETLPAGPKGSLFPGFSAADGRLRLLYRTAKPRGWEAVELDSEGRPARRSRVDAAGAARPLLAPGNGETAIFLWPAEGRSKETPWEKLR